MRGSSLRIELRLSCKYDCRAKLSRSGRRKWIQRINFPSTYIFGKRFTISAPYLGFFLEMKNMQLSFYAFPSITFRNTHSNHFPKNLFSEITVLLYQLFQFLCHLLILVLLYNVTIKKTYHCRKYFVFLVTNPWVNDRWVKYFSNN